MSAIDELLDPIQVPKMYRVRQNLDRPVLIDFEGELTKKIEVSNALTKIKKGQSIAVSAGSRGVANLPQLLKVVVNEIRKAGGIPFIVPAMGSHGGATAEGQEKILNGLGVTEETVGAPIRATMDVVRIGTTENDLPVYIDRFAHEADGIVILNRISSHVAFEGPYESGLMKMITIGLGKQKGADVCHNMGFGQMATNVPAIARVSLKKEKFLMAVGVLENPYHEIAELEVLLPWEIEDKEPALLRKVKNGMLPRLMFDSFDVLILDEIGKNISGTGFDTYVIGRFHTPYKTGGPRITKVAVLDLTDESKGNANGLGILDFTTRRVFEKMKFEQTYPNALTSTVVQSVKLPMVLKNDKQAIQAAIKTSNIMDKSRVRLVRIKNTKKVYEIEVSQSMLLEIKDNSKFEILKGPYDFKFDSNGNLEGMDK